jgi:hypothetical protein
MNWRAIHWWSWFSAGWATALFFVIGRWFVLCAFAGGLLGFLTLCVVDIFMARSNQRELRREYEKREGSQR